MKKACAFNHLPVRGRDFSLRIRRRFDDQTARALGFERSVLALSGTRHTGIQAAGIRDGTVRRPGDRFVNGTLGLLLKFLTIPLSIVTLGLFLLVINALMLELSAWFVPGFEVAGFGTAFLASLILSVLSVAVRELLSK